MIHTSPWFVGAFLICLSFVAGCGADVTDPATDDVEVTVEETPAESTKPAVAADKMLCNKTCILECGDCSCCL